ncbi:MAG: hypothetical protein GY913_30120 [Proteobacteria bacterium]|nr:hypothetical protein [Pseudomonadota bacterium]MCP4921174.1 hypothetical protein [Pseudomonadota bacterium]
MTPARHGLLAALAVAAVLPALLPDTALYVDNAPHLAELVVLAEAWPLPVAWADHQAGMAIGQLSAQAAWWPLAGLVRLGLPALPLYLLAIVLSNIVFALGVERLGRRLVSPEAGLFAAVLAAASAFDLYGIAGAAGGMWPFRLACGVLAFGIGARWRSGLWIAAVCLLHTFAAVIVVLVTLVEAVKDRRRLIDLAVGLALCAGWWIPLLAPELRSFPAFWDMGLADVGLLLFFPVDVMSWRLGGEVVAVGGPAGLAFHVLAIPLALLGLRSKLADRRLGLELSVVLALVLVGVVVVYPLTGFSLLGPNPWRHLLWWRVALALSAGAGLATLPRAASMAVGGAAVLAATLAGFHEIPVPSDLREDLEATHALVEGPGRVFHEDTFFRPGVERHLARGHAGALLGLRDTTVVSSWYSVASIPTLRQTASEAGATMGTRTSDLTAAQLRSRLKLYSVDRAVSTTPEVAALLAELGAVELGRHGPFVAWQLKAPMLFGARGAGAVISVDEPQRVVAELDGPADFLYRRSWHAWWSASLDGAPLLADHSAETGLIVGSTESAGRLEVSWAPRGLAWWLLALPALGAVWWRRRVDSPE